jgi:predicted FMN-binding regulatory protein PaiB
VYLPPHFTAPEAADVAAFVDAVAAADLVTFDGTKPVASQIPIIWDRDSGEYGRLLGHLALANHGPGGLTRIHRSARPYQRSCTWARMRRS